MLRSLLQMLLDDRHVCLPLFFWKLKKNSVYTVCEGHSKETEMATPWVEKKQFIPNCWGCLSRKAERSEAGVCVCVGGAVSPGL